MVPERIKITETKTRLFPVMTDRMDGQRGHVLDAHNVFLFSGRTLRAKGCFVLLSCYDSGTVTTQNARHF